jgi:hypothetical protein
MEFESIELITFEKQVVMKNDLPFPVRMEESFREGRLSACGAPHLMKYVHCVDGR